MSKVNACIIGVIQKHTNTNKIILATNSRKNRAEMVLQHHRLENIFDYMFFKEDYNQKNKFLHILNYFGASANSILVFENDNDEIRKAIEFGIPDKNITKVNDGEMYE
jgi:beta-phosphoglucomutase-like phosphatase (HAD superfamily)